MKTRTLKQLLLYNYRYWFGYSIIFLFAAFFLLWQLGDVRPGLSQLELDTAARHLNLMDIVKFPEYPVHSVLQWIIIKFFAVNGTALSLPSVAVSMIMAFFIYSLLKKWFGKATALLATSILISADWFLFIGRHGTGMIELSMWLAIALNCFTKLLERKYNWLIAFAIAIAGLILSPIGVYPAIGLLAILATTRVFRERMLESPLWVKTTSGTVLGLAIIYISVISSFNIDFLKTLIGLKEFAGIIPFLQNIFFNTAAIVTVLPHVNAEFSPSSILLVRFFEFTFILFGILMMYKTRVNRLNFAVIVLSLLLVIVSGLMPGQKGSSLLLVPAAIFITAGLRHLMHRWRKTFPTNPYARVVAYIPLGVLFICVTLLHYQSYFKLWPRQTAVHQVFTRDFTLVKNELNDSKGNTTCLVISSNESLKALLLEAKTSCQPVFDESRSNEVSKIIAHSSTAQADALKQENDAVKVLVNVAKEDNVRWIVATKK